MTDQNFIGREEELGLLSESYEDKNSKIVTLYGRRRIGKSSLIKYFSTGKRNFAFEGLKKVSTRQQLEHFFNTLREQTKDPLLVKPFTTWDQADSYLIK